MVTRVLFATLLIFGGAPLAAQTTNDPFPEPIEVSAGA